MLYIIPDSKRINTGELLMNGSLPLEVYENLDSIFDRAEFVDGMPVPQINEAVREIFNSDQESGVPFAVTRAKMLAFTLQHIRIAINASGKFAGVVERDYLSNRYETSAIRFIQWERYDKIAQEEFPDIYNRNKTESEKGTSVAALDLSHTCPDWERILTLGATGLLQLAEEKYDKNPSVFNESVLIAYRAFRDFIVRFAGIAEKHGRSDLAGILSGLARHAPQTLHEALQLSLLYFHVQEIEGEWVRSFGLFDRQFLPFFEKDMLCGRLTEESAEELLIHYFSFFHAESKGKDAGTAICFGGLLPGNDTEDGCNKLTYLAWQAFRKLGNPTPKFSLRVNPYTPDEILDFAAQCIQEGQNSMVFANEPLIRKAFLQQGKDRHDLANFVPIGCYEPAIMGKELSCTMTCDYNLAKPAELIFDDKTFSPSSFEEVEKYYFELLCSTLTDVMSRAVEYEKMWNKVNPSPILSGTMKECMERDLDVSEYGTKYAKSGLIHNEANKYIQIQVNNWGGFLGLEYYTPKDFNQYLKKVKNDNEILLKKAPHLLLTIFVYLINRDDDKSLIKQLLNYIDSLKINDEETTALLFTIADKDEEVYKRLINILNKDNNMIYFLVNISREMLGGSVKLYKRSKKII